MRITLIRTAKKAHREFVELTQKGSLTGKTITDYFLWIFKDRDLTVSGFRNYFDKKRLDNIRQVNNFFENDFARLGAELHAATYTVKLGGKYQLVNGSRWIALDEVNTKLSDILPVEKSKSFSVEGLDFSGTVIQADGLDNIEYCQNLKSLVFKNCAFIDDWAVARLANFATNKIEYLDLSGCLNITDNGLIMLGYLNNLKKLKIHNLNGVENKEFISILLEETIKGLEVEGSDHLSEESLKNFERKIDLENEKLKLLK